MIGERDPRFEHWVEAARAIELGGAAKVLEAATANMMVFEMPTGVDDVALGEALHHVLEEYRHKVEALGRNGLFYAWADEMSGTLRCSFCEVDRFEELPFRAKLDRVGSLAQLAALAFHRLRPSIPMNELVEVSGEERREAPVRRLGVFASVMGTAKQRGS